MWRYVRRGVISLHASNSQQSPSQHNRWLYTCCEMCMTCHKVWNDVLSLRPVYNSFGHAPILPFTALFTFTTNRFMIFIYTERHAEWIVKSVELFGWSTKLRGRHVGLLKTQILKSLPLLPNELSISGKSSLLISWNSAYKNKPAKMVWYVTVCLEFGNVTYLDCSHTITLITLL